MIWWDDRGVCLWLISEASGARPFRVVVGIARDPVSTLIDAGPGGGVIKQRIAHKNGIRSGGFRVTVLFRRGELAFFVHGFAKSDRDNLRRKELAGLRALANE